MSSTLSMFGLVTGSVFIEDIGIVVPFHEVVAVPADKAYASKDLWRAVSQRKVFYLNAGDASLKLVQATKQLPLEQVAEESSQIAAQSEKIDQLTDMVRQQGVLIQELLTRPASSRHPAQEVARTSAKVEETPLYIPSTVKPDVQEQRIQGETSTQESGSFSSAKDQLRAIRLKKKNHGK